MGLNIYPSPTTKISFDGTQNVNVVEKASSFASIKFSLTDNNTPQNFVILSNPSNRLVIHSITISQHLYGQVNDQLGIRVHGASTGGNVNTTNAIANNYGTFVTNTFNYDSGLKLPAGANLYYVFDYNSSGMSVNGFVTVVYSEVSA